MGTDRKHNRLESSWLQEERKPGRRIRNGYEFGLGERGVICAYSALERQTQIYEKGTSLLFGSTTCQDRFLDQEILSLS